MSTRLTKKAKDAFESIKTVDEQGMEWNGGPPANWLKH